MYSVKEVFYTLQGEGAQTGRPAIFCRFSGCNLWSGLEKHRQQAICRFCDTDFRGTDGSGGGVFSSAESLAFHVLSFWPEELCQEKQKPFVVCTGGEPLLQLDLTLIDAFHRCNCIIAVETNGTIEAPAGLDWLCVSPKSGSELLITTCDELKVVYPQEGLCLDSLSSRVEAHHYYLTPKADFWINDDTNLYNDEITRATVNYCLRHPKWSLNIQTHKIIGVA